MSEEAKVYRWFIGADHRGFQQKSALVNHLLKDGNDVEDIGCFSSDSVDYPHIARLMAKKVSASPNYRGILLCGSGVGMSVVANRFRGIRAALVWNEEVAGLSRAHNDANILVLPAAFLDMEGMLKILEVWATTPFEGGRHSRRVRMIEEVSEEWR